MYQFLLVFICGITYSFGGRIHGGGGGGGDEQPRILILGAGFAGVAAAERLSALGYTNYLIIEAGEIGGCVRSDIIGENRVELGPLFIRKGNAVFDLITKYNISFYEPDFDDYIVYDNNGTDITDGFDTAFSQFEEALEQVNAIATDRIAENRDDLSLRSSLIKAGWTPSTVAQDSVELFELLYEFGVRASQISTQEGFIPDSVAAGMGEVIINHPSGLSDALNGLVSDVVEGDEDKLALLTVVTKISQDDDSVTVTTSTGDEITGDFAIVTFSSAVLQTDAVEFEPPLPEWKTCALANLVNAPSASIFALFNSTFWDDREYIVYAGGVEEMIILNMNRPYPGSNILQFTLPSRNGEYIERLTDDEIISDLVRRLEKIYDEVPTPLEITLERFTENPFFKGYWGNRLPGFTLDVLDALKAPVGRVFFAGEYTSYLGYGYTFGAYESGLDVAEALHKCVRNSICQTYAPKCATTSCIYSSKRDFINIAKYGDRLCKLPAFQRVKSVGTTCNWDLRLNK